MTTPRVSFVIGGVQKGGTTALARYLSRHPGIVLPRSKEAHVFDAPDFDDRGSAADVDGLYAPHFRDDATPGVLHGDATPIYMFHPVFVARIARYNPAMRWILVLRDPVDRAISQYYMERGRGDETLPLALALLAERRRLKGHGSDFSHRSPLRHHSYLARGDYATQLDTLRGHFPDPQILVLQSGALRADPAACVGRALAFLGLPAMPGPQAYPDVFTGDYHGRRLPRLLRPWVAWMLRRELRALRERYGIAFDR